MSETPSQTLARVEREYVARREKLRKLFSEMPDGTTIKGWTKITLGEDAFWQKKTRFITYLHEEIGWEATKEVLGDKYISISDVADEVPPSYME